VSEEVRACALVHLRNRASEDLCQIEACNYIGCSDRYAIRVAYSELDRDGSGPTAKSCSYLEGVEIVVLAFIFVLTRNGKTDSHELATVLLGAKGA